jgi:hypothetical protein
MKAGVIYYGGIPNYFPEGQSGTLFLNEEGLVFRGPQIDPYHIPINRIKGASVIKEYIHVVFVVILAIEYLDERGIQRTLKVRVRTVGWPWVLRRTNLWIKEINRSVKKK